MANLILRLNELDATINAIHTTLEMETGYDTVYESELRSGDKSLAAVGYKEDLIVAGHGNPTSLGGHSPQSLAALIAKGGVRGPVTIQLYACNSGSGGAPYALELKVELVQKHKIMCSVGGTRGYLGVNRLGELDVIDGNRQSVPNPTFDTTKAF